MKTLTIVLFAALLAGCASSTPKVPDYQFPANLTTPCDKLPHIRAGSLADLYKYTIEIATLYNQCAMRHDALSEAVKKSK
jgi:uncharacterized lipoprotein YmbA